MKKILILSLICIAFTTTAQSNLYVLKNNDTQDAFSFNNIRKITPSNGLSELTVYLNDNTTQVYTKNNVRLLSFVNYNLNVSVQEILQSNSLQVFPNPVKDLVNVKFVLNENALINIELFNLSGASVQQESVMGIAGNNNFPIRLNNLSAGIYVLKIQQNTHNSFAKIIVQ
jgi:hypothetical protein